MPAKSMLKTQKIAIISVGVFNEVCKEFPQKIRNYRDQKRDFSNLSMETLTVCLYTIDIIIGIINTDC